ncbi:molting defective [Haematobia irritans]|uniref:molting defective n=1 Tax=Haematobia irritans TaxID=7368 RepID=UPI003F4F9487
MAASVASTLNKTPKITATTIESSANLAAITDEEICQKESNKTNNSRSSNSSNNNINTQKTNLNSQELCRSCGKTSEDLYDLYHQPHNNNNNHHNTNNNNKNNATSLPQSTSDETKPSPFTTSSTTCFASKLDQETKTVATTSAPSLTSNSSTSNACHFTAIQATTMTFDSVAATAKATAKGQSNMDNILQEMQIWHLQIKCNDGLPQRICAKCTAQFYMIHKFRRKCLKVQAQMRNMYEEELRRLEQEPKQQHKCQEKMLETKNDEGEDGPQQMHSEGTDEPAKENAIVNLVTTLPTPPSPPQPPVSSSSSSTFNVDIISVAKSFDEVSATETPNTSTTTTTAAITTKDQQLLPLATETHSLSSDVNQENEGNGKSSTFTEDANATLDLNIAELDSKTNTEAPNVHVKTTSECFQNPQCDNDIKQLEPMVKRRKRNNNSYGDPHHLNERSTIEDKCQNEDDEIFRNVSETTINNNTCQLPIQNDRPDVVAARTQSKPEKRRKGRPRKKDLLTLTHKSPAESSSLPLTKAALKSYSTITTRANSSAVYDKAATMELCDLSANNKMREKDELIPTLEANSLEIREECLNKESIENLEIIMACPLSDDNNNNQNHQDHKQNKKDENKLFSNAIVSESLSLAEDQKIDLTSLHTREPQQESLKDCIRKSFSGREKSSRVKRKRSKNVRSPASSCKTTTISQISCDRKQQNTETLESLARKSSNLHDMKKQPKFDSALKILTVKNQNSLSIHNNEGDGDKRNIFTISPSKLFSSKEILHNNKGNSTKNLTLSFSSSISSSLYTSSPGKSDRNIKNIYKTLPAYDTNDIRWQRRRAQRLYSSSSSSSTSLSSMSSSSSCVSSSTEDDDEDMDKSYNDDELLYYDEANTNHRIQDAASHRSKYFWKTKAQMKANTISMEKIFKCNNPSANEKSESEIDNPNNCSIVEDLRLQTMNEESIQRTNSINSLVENPICDKDTDADDEGEDEKDIDMCDPLQTTIPKDQAEEVDPTVIKLEPEFSSQSEAKSQINICKPTSEDTKQKPSISIQNSADSHTNTMPAVNKRKQSTNHKSTVDNRSRRGMKLILQRRSSTRFTCLRKEDLLSEHTDVSTPSTSTSSSPVRSGKRKLQNEDNSNVNVKAIENSIHTKNEKMDLISRECDSPIIADETVISLGNKRSKPDHHANDMEKNLPAKTQQKNANHLLPNTIENEEHLAYTQKSPKIEGNSQTEEEEEEISSGQKDVNIDKHNKFTPNDTQIQEYTSEFSPSLKERIQFTQQEKETVMDNQKLVVRVPLASLTQHFKRMHLTKATYGEEGNWKQEETQIISEDIQDTLNETTNESNEDSSLELAVKPSSNDQETLQENRIANETEISSDSQINNAAHELPPDSQLHSHSITNTEDHERTLSKTDDLTNNENSINTSQPHVELSAPVMAIDNDNIETFPSEKDSNVHTDQEISYEPFYSSDQMEEERKTSENIDCKSYPGNANDSPIEERETEPTLTNSDYDNNVITNNLDTLGKSIENGNKATQKEPNIRSDGHTPETQTDFNSTSPSVITENLANDTNAHEISEENVISTSNTPIQINALHTNILEVVAQESVSIDCGENKINPQPFSGASSKITDFINDFQANCINSPDVTEGDTNTMDVLPHLATTSNPILSAEIRDVEDTLNGILNEMHDRDMYNTPRSGESEDFLAHTSIYSPMTDAPTTPSQSLYAESPRTVNSNPMSLSPFIQTHMDYNAMTPQSSMSGHTTTTISSISSSHQSGGLSSDHLPSYTDCFAEESTQSELIGFQNDIPCFENIELNANGEPIATSVDQLSNDNESENVVRDKEYSNRDLLESLDKTDEKNLEEFPAERLEASIEPGSSTLTDLAEVATVKETATRIIEEQQSNVHYEAGEQPPNDYDDQNLNAAVIIPSTAEEPSINYIPPTSGIPPSVMQYEATDIDSPTNANLPPLVDETTNPSVPYETEDYAQSSGLCGDVVSETSLMHQQYILTNTPHGPVFISTPQELPHSQQQNVQYVTLDSNTASNNLSWSNTSSTPAAAAAATYYVNTSGEIYLSNPTFNTVLVPPQPANAHSSSLENNENYIHVYQGQTSQGSEQHPHSQQQQTPNNTYVMVVKNLTTGEQQYIANASTTPTVLLHTQMAGDNCSEISTPQSLGEDGTTSNENVFNSFPITSEVPSQPVSMPMRSSSEEVQEPSKTSASAPVAPPQREITRQGIQRILQQRIQSQKPLLPRASTSSPTPIRIPPRTQKISLICRFCHKRPKFTNNVDYSNHIITMHPAEKPYNCDYCPKHFQRRSERQDHVAQVHGSRYQCAQCGVSFCAQRALDFHLQKFHASTMPCAIPPRIATVAPTQQSSSQQSASATAALNHLQQNSTSSTSSSSLAASSQSTYNLLHSAQQQRLVRGCTEDMLAHNEKGEEGMKNKHNNNYAFDSQLDITDGTTVTPHNHHHHHQQQQQQHPTQQCYKQQQPTRKLCCPDCNGDDDSCCSMKSISQNNHKQLFNQQFIGTNLNDGGHHNNMPSPDHTEPDSTTTLRNFRKNAIKSLMNNDGPSNCSGKGNACLSCSGCPYNNNNNNNKCCGPPTTGTTQYCGGEKRNVSRDYQCHLCDDSFATGHALRKHRNTVHNNQCTMPFVCTICRRGFRLRNALQRHMETHDAEGRPYGCNICHVRFPRPSQLTLHKLTVHKFENVHTCDECGKQFGTESSLKAHEKVAHEANTMPLPFACVYLEAPKCQKPKLAKK